MNWLPVDSVPIGRYVLIARLSGYSGTKWDFLVAIFIPDYKGWTDAGNDRLSDSGEEPTFWAPLPEGPVE